MRKMSETSKVLDEEFDWVVDTGRAITLSKTKGLTGGPAQYYDLPYNEWDTTNDMGEYLAKNRWKEYSLHFKDLLKALVRFGAKDGTSMQYDIEKMIYSGCRAMIMLSGRQALRDYLQKLLDDPQFKTKENQ